MTYNRKLYNAGQQIAALAMILALVWLTISAPFLLRAQQQLTAYQQQAEELPAPASGEEDNSGPFGNTTEEKAPSSVSLAEEFLHEHHLNHPILNGILSFSKSRNDGTYMAFHGELLVPPPNAA